MAWCLCQLATHISNAGDPGAFAAFLAGVAHLAEDAAAVCAARAGAESAHSRRSGHHAGHGHNSVILAFGESMALVVHAESGPETPPQAPANASRRENKNKSANERNDAGAPSGESDARSSGVLRKELVRTCALALEITGISAASALAYVACKLVAHVLRVAPQASACLLSARAARAAASVSSDAAVGHETRRAALAATRGVLVECAAELVAPEFVLPHLAATLRDRAALCARATPPRGKRRDAFDAELAACVDAAAERFLVEKTAGHMDTRGYGPSRVCSNASTRRHDVDTTRGRIAPNPAAARHLDAFAAACVSTLEAGEGAVAECLRAAALGRARVRGDEAERGGGDDTAAGARGQRGRRGRARGVHGARVLRGEAGNARARAARERRRKRKGGAFARREAAAALRGGEGALERDRTDRAFEGASSV